jgi:hypothetical protein
VTGKPRQGRPSQEGKKAVTQHLWRHHDKTSFFGDRDMRMAAHDDLHFFAKENGRDLGHTHLPLQEGESLNEVARRYLAEGTAAQPSSE